MISPTASAIPVERGGPAAEGEARSSRPFILGSVNSSKRGSATDSRNSAGYQPLRERAGGSDDRYAFRAGNLVDKQSLPAKLRVLDLFSGIGGFSLGLERTGGFETVAFCEIDKNCHGVLASHWPTVRRFHDVRELKGHDIGPVDGICGGFPCQDASVANHEGLGTAGERTGLFTEIIRLARELAVQFILMENVPNLLNRGFGAILGALAEIGFDAEWECISARELGFDHERERLIILAYPQRTGWQGPKPYHGALKRAKAALSQPCDAAIRARRAVVGYKQFLRDGDGLSIGMERRRLHALGNAVVPQKFEAIGNAILASLRESVAA